MFNFARKKLTVWYLLIIMLISVSFSVAMYGILTRELDRVERIQRLRIERRLPLRPDNLDMPPRFRLDPQLIAETKTRLAVTLGLINLIILSFTTVAGYFLAGRTLQPIKNMVDEQNRFISDASHELRTPLTSLKTEIEVNLRDKKLTLTNAKNLLVSNLDEVDKLQSLSDGLIKIIQFNDGKNGLRFSDFSLISVIQEAVKKISARAKNKNITIENNVKESQITGDKFALEELFVIFLDNAVKYSPQNTKISLSSEKNDQHILIHIKDQGIGIDEEDIPYLFNRFFRADKSRTKGEVAGYGLGLAIAKEIIEKHHGSISVASKVNKGTIFTVCLPEKQIRRLI